MRTQVQWGLFLLAGVGFLIAAAGEAQARPSYGSDCAGCHTTARDNAIAVTDYDGMFNLDDVNLGSAVDRGLLKYYDVVRGNTLTLSFDVLDGSDNRYAVKLDGLLGGGVMNDVNNRLVYVADSSWFDQTDNTGETYYTKDAGDGESGIAWGGQPVSYTFDLFVDAATPLDTYDLVFGLAGRRTSSPGRNWYDEEHFYVRVLNAVPEPSSWVMMLSGLGLGLGLYWRRRKR